MFERKKIVQDILPPGSRSIRRISIDKPSRREPDIRQIEREEESEPTPVPPPPPVKRGRTNNKKNGSSWKKIITVIIVVVCVVIIGLGASVYFSNGKVVITPKSEVATIKGTFTAKQSPIGDELGYSLVTVTDTASTSVPSTDGPLLSVNAKGTVTLYNMLSTTPQKIVATTRLEGTNGLIYRTDATVTIPGMKNVGGKAVAGTITVKMTADKPGQDYNISTTDSPETMKVVAYKGTLKYETIYAKASSPIIGGFLGHKKIVDRAALDTAKKTLSDSLKAKLIADARTQASVATIIYDNGYVMDIVYNEPAGDESSNASLSAKATLIAVSFLTDDISHHITKDVATRFANIPYMVKGLDTLDFKIVNIKDISPKTTLPLVFTVNGNVTLVGTFSAENLARDIAGLDFTEANKIFSRYRGISSATISVNPPWWRTLPSDTAKITIEIKSK